VASLAELAPPALFTLVAWWASTGVILWLVRLPRITYGRTLLGATAVLVAALLGLAATRADTSVTGAYVAFVCTLLVWGWQEVTFLTGFATGARDTPCPPGARGWRRFGFATEAILHHELILALAGLAVVAVTWGGANQLGAWTYALLWTMRLSAKLNLFLGVRNLNTEFLPEHLRYLASYFVRRPLNLLFPFSVTAATAVTVLLWSAALGPGATPFEVTGLALLAALATLAVLEHWFLVLPLPAEQLWRWALGTPRTDAAAAEARLRG
jgi:putative photosynthetic complex assembly protein 2